MKNTHIAIIEDDNVTILGFVTQEEVRTKNFNMGVFKSHGLDGFTLASFQEFGTLWGMMCSKLPNISLNLVDY